MARGSSKPPRRRNTKEEARAKRKGCMYCKHKIDEVDYKRFANLRTLISEKGKKIDRIEGVVGEPERGVTLYFDVSRPFRWLERSLKPGRATIRTARKPMHTPIQLACRTRSPRNGPDKATTSSGPR